MTNLLSPDGLKIDAFDPVLAAVIGNKPGQEGAKVLAEAVLHSRDRVELRDWMYCLAKSPITSIHKQLVDRMGKAPEKFIGAIEGGYDQPSGTGMPPFQLSSEVVAPEVLQMLDRAEALRHESGKARIVDAALTLALLDAADDELRTGLELWAEAERLDAFHRMLLAELRPTGDVVIDFFGPDGKLNVEQFSSGGRRLCKRLQEDAAGLGAKQITTRHLLYTLLGGDSSLLVTALSLRGIDVKMELHANLSRQLTRPGKKRSEGLALTRETIFDGVVEVFRESYKQTTHRGATEIAVCDIERAFLLKEPQELIRLLPQGASFDLPGLRDYLDTAAIPEEEPESAVARYSIPEIARNIKDRICGQEFAVQRVMPWIKRLRFGLPREGRPAAVFLFLGPTGSGKTQLAKELARYVFGDPEMMIFLEMGQFKTKESMSGFIGAPPGYKGYGEGLLTNGLRDKPECVVLFDEIEKAAVEVFDVLLRFADEGMISDPAGPVRDGRKCVIVLTTNAGQAWLRAQVKGNPAIRDDTENLPQQLFEAAQAELQEKGFRPEFLGRVDERISFLPFSLDTCRKIIDLNLKSELGKFKDLKGVTIEVDDACRDLMAAAAHKRSMDEGARGAPRAVNECIVTPAIDLLSEFEGRRLPRRLVASVRGGDTIHLEIAEPV